MDRSIVFKALIFCCIPVACFSINTTRPPSTTTAKPETKYKLLCWHPIPMKSHQNLFQPLIRELVARGHHVTLVTPMPMSDPPPNLEQVLIKDQTEEMLKVLKMQGILDRILPWRLEQASINYFESFYEDPAVQSFLKSDREFDGILMEVMMNENFIALQHKYNAPVIDIMPVPHFHLYYYHYGIPYDSSYITDTMAPYTDHMSFIERLHNTVLSLMIRLIGEMFIVPSSEQIMNKHLRYPGWEARPSLKEMIKNVSLVLINTHFSVSYSYPLPPHAKEIAGINILPPKSLPKDLQNFMDSSKDGVIVFSFGSHISMEKTLGPERIDTLVRFFGSLKQKVLWKHDGEVANLPANIRLTKWFPQMDVLGHPNIRLFISHCGYHSSIEAIYHGVPVVAIPIQGDQTKNAKMLTHYGLALTLTLDNITAESLAWTVNEVMSNQRFKEIALVRSKIYRDQKEPPLETAIYWTEYVLRHDGAHHLKPAVINMPWYQHALIDVYVALSLIVLLPLLILYYLLKCILCRLCTRRKATNKKKNS